MSYLRMQYKQPTFEGPFNQSFFTKINFLCKSGTWTADHGLNGAPTLLSLP